MAHANTATKEAPSTHKMLRHVLGIQVLYKVLFANSIIIFIGATGGTWLASNLNNSHQSLATPVVLLLFVALGWLVSVFLNFVVLQIAFLAAATVGFAVILGFLASLLLERRASNPASEGAIRTAGLRSG